MSKHTPGPWEVRGNDIYQVRGRHVAYTGPHHTPEADYPQGCKLADQANARLIAAAPDLMEALEDVVKREATECTLHNALAALAKAKGEQQ